MKEAFYKSLLAESPCAYAYHKIILDEQGEPCDYEFLEVNPAFEQQTGFRAEDIIGKRISQVLPRIGKTEYDWIHAYGKVALTGEPVVFDQYSEGLKHWYRVKAYSLEKYFFIVRFTDITVEARQEAAIHNFFDISPDMLCIINLEGSFLLINKAWEKVMGYMEEEMVGNEYLSFVHPDDVEKTKRHVLMLKNRKESTSFVNRFRSKNGDYRYLEWYSSIEGGAAYAAARDITKKKKEEKRIRSVLAELETIYNTTHDGLFMARLEDCGFRYINCNNAYKALTGIASLEGKTPQDIFGEEIGQAVAENYMRCIEKREKIEFEETLALPTGTRTLHTILTPVFNEDQSAYIVGSRRDITEEIKAGEEVRRNLMRNECLVRVLQKDSDSLQDYLDSALEQALQLTQSKYGYIYLYDENKKEFTLNSWSSDVMINCSVHDKTTVYQLDQTGVWGEAVRQRKPIILNNFNAPDPLKKGLPEGHVRFSRYMTIPVTDGKDIVAVVGLADKGSDYHEMDVLQLTILMNGVWKEVVRRNSESLLREEKERLRITLLSVGDGVISTDANGKIQLMNKVAEDLTGWTMEEGEGADFTQVFNIVNEYTGEKSEDPIKRVLDSGNIVGLANHTILISKDGMERPIADSAAPIKQKDGTVNGVVLVFRDVTVQRQKQSLIEHLSFHDQLTDLYNRRFFEEELHRLDTERNLPVSIIMADVNGLKLTNDAFGHSVGDLLLVRAAEAIQMCCRGDDIISRLGGDEFVVLLPKTGIEEAESLSHRIMKQCSRIKVDAVSLSLSCGCAVKTSCGEKIYDVLKMSEDKMYQHKLFEGPSIRGQIIDAIVNALYEANRREKSHSERVSGICVKIGQALGCSEREIQELRTAGLLHDIGKVAINVSIIDKPGKLTDAEWIEIRRHPEIGYRILNAINDMSVIAHSVLAHHERWNGTGYPRGLSGENIPLYARVLAIADAFDAMTCSRPYKESMTVEQAKMEIIMNSNTQFDAKLAQLFVKDVLPFI